MNIDRWLQAGSNIVAALFGVFAGLAIADFEGIEPWLYRWQSLVAGALAIVAAALTVIAMLTADDRQGKRHRELVTLALRDEYRRLSRANYTAQNLLRSWIKGSRELAGSGFARGDPSADKFATANTVDVWMSIRELSEIYDQISASGAVDLLGGRESAIYRNLGKRVQKLKETKEFLFEGDRAFLFEADQREVYERFATDFSLALSNAMVFVGVLAKLERSTNPL